MKTFSVQFKDPLDLKPYANNNKSHTRGEVLFLANVIKNVGFDQPIVVDKDYVVIKGHKRRLAAIYLKLPQVPVIIRDDLTEPEVMALRIADNQAHLLSSTSRDKEKVEEALVLDLNPQLAKEVFVFMAPQLDSNFGNVAPPKATDPTKGEKTKESLINCPKCQHVFVEVKS